MSKLKENEDLYVKSANYLYQESDITEILHLKNNLNL
jgi:hypothetical protein